MSKYNWSAFDNTVTAEPKKKVYDWSAFDEPAAPAPSDRPQQEIRIEGPSRVQKLVSGVKGFATQAATGAASGSLGLLEGAARIPETAFRMEDAANKAFESMNSYTKKYNLPPVKLDDVTRMMSPLGPTMPKMSGQAKEGIRGLITKGEVGGKKYGVNIRGQKVGGLSDVADQLHVYSGLLPTLHPAFERGQKLSEEFNNAFDELLVHKRPERLYDVLLNPEAWGHAIGQAAPSLATAYASGGHIGVIGLMEALGASNDAAAFEKRNGIKMTDQQFAQSVAQTGLINIVFEKSGVDFLLKKVPARPFWRALARRGVGGVWEGVTEAVQQFNSNVAQYLSYDPKKSLTSGILESAVGGAGSGVLAGGRTEPSDKAQADVNIKGPQITPMEQLDALQHAVQVDANLTPEQKTFITDKLWEKRKIIAEHMNDPTMTEEELVQIIMDTKAKNTDQRDPMTNEVVEIAQPLSQDEVVASKKAEVDLETGNFKQSPGSVIGQVFDDIAENVVESLQQNAQSVQMEQSNLNRKLRKEKGPVKGKPTLIAEIRRRGGISLQNLKAAGYTWQDVKEFGLLPIMKTNGPVRLDALAEEWKEAGVIPRDSTRPATDVLMDELKKKAKFYYGEYADELDKDIERQYQDRAKDLQDADDYLREHPEENREAYWTAERQAEGEILSETGSEDAHFGAVELQQVLNPLKLEVYAEDIAKEKAALKQEVQQMIAGTEAKFPDKKIAPADKNLIQEKRPNELFKEAAPNFYSHLERTVQEKMPSSTSPEQVRGILKNSGTKQEEQDWLGVDQFLEGKEKVSKQELLDFIAANNVKVEEVVKGGSSYRINTVSNNEHEVIREGDDSLIGTYKTLEDAEQAVKDFGSDQTKFSAYQLPGGTGYKELLLTLPVTGESNSAEIKKLDDEIADIQYQGKDYQKRLAMVLADNDLLGFDTYGMAINAIRFHKDWRDRWQVSDEDARLIKSHLGKYDDLRTQSEALQNKQNELRSKERGVTFKSGHFDEPNVLAHIRFNERTDSEGKKVLFIEELQSDWHQKGRKEGYTGEIKLPEGYETVHVKENGENYWRVIDPDGNRVSNGETEKQAIANMSQFHREGVPNAPFKKTWHELALKRMLRYAVESGSAAWQTATKPKGFREELQKYLGSELATVSPLKVMDASMLPALQNDQIRKAVVKAIPVDVVNILSKNGFTAEDLASKPNVVGKTLPVDSRAAVSRGLADALQLVGTRLRTALNGVLSGKTTRGDNKLFETIRASDLSPDVIIGLLAPSRIYGLDGSVTLSRLGGAKTGTEFPVSRGDNARVGWEPSSTELATLLNRHDAIISNRSDAGNKYSPSYDKLAFTTGDQQAERYDLSKQVDNIGYNPNPDGTVDIAAFGKSGEIIVSDEAMSIKKVAETFGKDIAEKVSKNKGTKRRVLKGDPDSQQEYVLKGEDLKVGGEGMKGFYDLIIPSFLNKYTKKWGGRVGTTAIDLNADTDVLQDKGFTQEQIDGGLKVHSLDITDSMKQSVMGGQPLFSIMSNTGTSNFKDESAKINAVLGRNGVKDIVIALRDEIRTPEGNLAYGSYLPGESKINLLQEPSSITGYHESLHGLIRKVVFKDPKLMKMFFEVKAEYQKTDGSKWEEPMADDFANASNRWDTLSGKVKAFFEALWLKIKELFGKLTIKDKQKILNRALYSGKTRLQKGGMVEQDTGQVFQEKPKTRVQELLEALKANPDAKNKGQRVKDLMREVSAATRSTLRPKTKELINMAGVNEQFRQRSIAKQIVDKAIEKGLIYTKQSGQVANRLHGLLQTYPEYTGSQMLDFISALSGSPGNPPRILKLTGNPIKDIEIMDLVSKLSSGWSDINPVEVTTLETPRIIEKVSGLDLWDENNVLAQNTFDVLAQSDSMMHDRLADEIGQVEAHKEGIKKYSKTDKDLMRKYEAGELLTDKEQRVVTFLRKKYNSLIDEANSVRRKLKKPEIKYRTDYMTHIIERNLLDGFFKGDYSGQDNITPAQMEAIRKGDYTKGNMPFNRFALQRKGQRTKLGAIGNFEVYLKTILKEVYYAPALTHARKFSEYALVRQPNAYKALDRLFNEMKGKPSILDEWMVGKFLSSRPVQWLRGRLAASALLGNISFNLVNGSNFATAYPEIGNWVNVGMARFLSDKQMRDFAFKKSILLKGRTIDVDFDETTMKNIEKFLAKFNSYLELNNVGSVWVGAYLKGTKELGYSEATAIKYADTITRRTQAGYKKYELNAWMRSNSGKVLSQFQTWSFNAMGHILYDLRLANAPRTAQKLLSGRARRLLISGPDDKKDTRVGALIGLAVMAMFVNALYKRLGIRKPYNIGAAVPDIPGVPKLGDQKFGSTGVSGMIENAYGAFTGKKPETRDKKAMKALFSLLPGGAQANRLANGRILPEPYEEKEKHFALPFVDDKDYSSPKKRKAAAKGPRPHKPIVHKGHKKRYQTALKPEE